MWFKCGWAGWAMFIKWHKFIMIQPQQEPSSLENRESWDLSRCILGTQSHPPSLCLHTKEELDSLDLRFMDQAAESPRVGQLLYSGSWHCPLQGTWPMWFSLGF